jgi:hypothetical protein
MAIGKRKPSFEPQFRFSLEEKPWSFLFWWRYQVLTTHQFQIKIGVLGFTEVTHFHNFIKKYVQLSPLKFRNV